MGYTSYGYRLCGDSEIKAEISRIYTGKSIWANTRGTTLRAESTVLDIALVAGIAYLAVREDVDGGESRTYAGVCQYDNKADGYGFGYRDMTEGSNPGHYDCPPRILKLLTAPYRPEAAEWRDAVSKKLRTLAKRRATIAARKGFAYSSSAS